LTPEAWYLAFVVLGALGLFYTGWIRADLTALLVMLSLMIPWRPVGDGWAPVLTTAEAFSGFGSSAVVMVAAMFVLSRAMVRTGGAELLGGWLLDSASRSERGLQLAILGAVTLFSAFINDTTTVIVWMPLVVAVAERRGYAVSRFLLPLAYASLLGGQWTLIGTRSNILVSDYLAARTGEGLGFFIFTPVALLVWGVCLLYFMLIGRRWLPAAKGEHSLADQYQVTEYLSEVLAAPGSEMIGCPLGELPAVRERKVTVLEIIRGEDRIPPNGWVRILAGDVLVVQGRVSQIAGFLRQPGFELREELKIGERTLRSVDLHMVEGVVTPNSDLEGQTLEEVDFQQTFGVSVLAVGRQGKSLGGRPLEEKLRVGDSLLLVGHQTELDRLRRDPNLFILESRPLPAMGKTKAYGTLALLGFIVVFSAFRLLEPAFVIPLAAVAAVLLGCIGLRQAYEAIDLHVLVLVGGMIPLGLALEKTGTAHRLAEAVVEWVGGGPQAAFAALLLVTVLLTQLIENAAVAVVLAPVGYALAVALGADPVPFLLGVAICASAAFMTPVAHESTMLVAGPGRYTFRDFLVVGTPMALITWLVTAFAVPLFYPF
jgi:di/tricarboxylate transporter